MSSLIPKNKNWIVLGILSLLYSVSLVSLAYVSKLILDYAELGNKNNVIIFGLVFVGIICLGVLFKIMENWVYARVSLKREIELKRELFENKLTRSFFSDNTHSGLLMQSYTTDVNNIVNGETNTLPKIFYELGRLVFAVILVLIIDWHFLIILLILGVLGLIVARFYSNYMKRFHQRVLANEGKLNSFVQESVENIKLIKSYEAENNFMKYYQKHETNYGSIKRKMYTFQIWAGNFLVLGSNIIYATCIFYGGYNIAVGLMTYGTLIALIQLMGHIQNPIMAVSGIINSLTLYKTSLERLNAKLNNKEEVKTYLTDFEQIKINDLGFGYNDLLFKNLSFNINKGDIIEIKGHSGIGKTSLFMVLLGFLKPQEGNVKAYLNQKEYEGELAKNLFSYVAQDNILFSGSIRDNFNLLAGDDAKIVESLKFANVYEELEALPNGLDTVLNERGSGLSIGQLQRVMIAIAYAKNRPIFLLDEFTSALDEANAETIINNLQKENKTVIYISHKNEKIKPTQVIDLTKYLTN